MYKITIDCSDVNNFSFCGEKITKGSYNMIHNQLKPERFDFLVRINILHKSFINKNGRYIKITNFEVQIDEISEEELRENFFLAFIDKLKECGFTSENNCCVRALNMGDPNNGKSYTCKFNNNKVREYKPKKKTIKWFYKTQTLYKK
jgi:hypothetical protein